MANSPRGPRFRNHSLMSKCTWAGSGFHVTPRAVRSLSAWYGQHGHDLDGVAREDGKVRMPLEEFGGGLVRVRAYNRESAHVIVRIIDPALRDLLGFAQRSAHGDDDGVMLLDPGFPRRHAFSFLLTAIAFGKSVPGHSSRTGFAAKEHCE